MRYDSKVGSTFWRLGKKRCTAFASAPEDKWVHNKVTLLVFCLWFHFRFLNEREFEIFKQ